MSKPDTSAILAKLHKDFGAEIGGLGDKYVNLPRLPFDIFPLDLALGGGIPWGKLTEIYGPESSNKTNKVLKLIRSAQRMYPDKKQVFIDAEHALDPSWATKMGVDMDRVIVMHPDFAEQAVDFVEAFLYAPDVSLVALDSVAALITANEIASSADKAVVGGASAVVGKMIRKAVLAMGQARKQNPEGFAPAFVCINQIRHKIGVMFGDPETTPGGNALRFAAACRLRSYGKNVVEKKIDPAMPSYKECNIIIRKWKFPILQVNAQYSMQMLKFGGRGYGHVEDFNTVATFLKECDYLTKGHGGSWLLSGSEFQTLAAVRQYLESDPEVMASYKAAIISEMVDKGDGIAPASNEADGEAPEELADIAGDM